jgi:hypothetical protein
MLAIIRSPPVRKIPKVPAAAAGSLVRRVKAASPIAPTINAVSTMYLGNPERKLIEAVDLASTDLASANLILKSSCFSSAKISRNVTSESSTVVLASIAELAYLFPAFSNCEPIVR